MEPIYELSNLISSLFGSLTSGDQIANMCRENLIQGFTHNIMSDPMTKLVRGKINYPIAFVAGHNFGSCQFLIFSNNKNISIQAPYVCGEFYENFKLDKYPDLLAFPTDCPKGD